MGGWGALWRPLAAFCAAGDQRAPCLAACPRMSRPGYAARFAARRVFSSRGEELGTIDTGGLENYMATVSRDGRWVAAATFTSDVKVRGLERVGAPV